MWGAPTGQAAPAQVWNPEDQHPTTTGELPRFDEHRPPEQPRRYYRPAARPEAAAEADPGTESDPGRTVELPVQHAPATPAAAPEHSEQAAETSAPGPEAIRQDEEIGHDLDLDDAPSQGR